MSLIYIKGTPGSGKSTIHAELQKLDYESHDADDDDIGSAYNNATNERVDYPDYTPTEEWFAAHSWRLIPEAIEALHQRAHKKVIFLCGTASNEDELWHLFDRVLFLDIDKDTLKKRLASRANNSYGKAEHELKLIIEKYHNDRQKRDRTGVVIINAELPISDVVKSILQASA